MNGVGPVRGRDPVRVQPTKVSTDLDAVQLRSRPPGHETDFNTVSSTGCAEPRAHETRSSPFAAESSTGCADPGA